MNFNLALVCLVAMAACLVQNVQGQCQSYYAINAGESCDVIASKNKITFAMLVLLNPGIENRCPFPTGFVCVPSTFQTIVQPTNPTCVYSYRVTGVETCTTIAAQYAAAVTVIAALNPSLNCQSAIPVGTTVCVPNPTPVVATTTTVAPPISSCMFPYLVQNGESCTSIAARYGVSLALILALNPNLNCGSLTGGNVICVPASSAPSSVTTTVAPSTTGCVFAYVVKSGDTCDGISRAYGVSLAFLLAINPTISCNNLQVNQLICAPSSTTVAPVQPTAAPTAAPSTVTCSGIYTIKSGDTCNALASTFGITLAQFLSINPNINCNLLQIGQSVCVPNIARTCSFGHVIVSGNTCWELTVRYGITLTQLVNKNPAINCGNLQIGQLVCIA